MLERECDCSQYEFIDGVPSMLNQMLRRDKIDISPSSSIEYLRYGNKYNIIAGHSISSIGTVGSIILFSRKPIEALNGQTVFVSSQSETSVALLEIILRRFFKIECNLVTADIRPDALPANAKAYLLIGDDALRKVKGYKLKVKSENPNSELQTPNSKLTYIYDLGELWHKHTGLPFTFALWIYRKECSIEKAELFEKFKNDLDKARLLALKNLETIAKESPLKGVLTESELVSYWRQISYDLGDEHKKGLDLFRRFSGELRLIVRRTDIF